MRRSPRAFPNQCKLAACCIRTFLSNSVASITPLLLTGKNTPHFIALPFSRCTRSHRSRPLLRQTRSQRHIPAQRCTAMSTVSTRRVRIEFASHRVQCCPAEWFISQRSCCAVPLSPPIISTANDKCTACINCATALFFSYVPFPSYPTMSNRISR